MYKDELKRTMKKVKNAIKNGLKIQNEEQIEHHSSMSKKFSQ